MFWIQIFSMPDHFCVQNLFRLSRLFHNRSIMGLFVFNITLWLICSSDPKQEFKNYVLDKRFPFFIFRSFAALGWSQLPIWKTSSWICKQIQNSFFTAKHTREWLKARKISWYKFIFKILAFFANYSCLAIHQTILTNICNILCRPLKLDHG